MPEPKIAPSLLAGDFSNLQKEVVRMVDYGSDWLHVDIMDSQFVPQLTIGPVVVKCMRNGVPKEKAFFDCHMMVMNPERWVDDFADAGANLFCFHYEATEKHMEVIERAHARGMRVGCAIKPKTPVEAIEPLVAHLDMVLVMTVEPGKGGQSFMPECLPKVEYLRQRYPELDIEVDGGVSPKTIDSAANAGANVIVAGTAVFLASSPKDVIATLRSSVLRAQAEKPWAKEK
ncbi:ribulose phosphate 3-epimerase [Schizosaccharomyces japonicus yFS275]|uniref:Ribulose-phosphate 3-epimerase n=1 Tax=Schizosaccharomyces japonicus (strain yFS275 / FY16936) TaxID=402676 RepID=B6JVT4_SCHJY|nr:ribulose phosphate 3-epimerase [Schizosaccharomyces japonicus yFS275]EEB05485.1 ribulose phosphate 3-epimerase [Schizosaccharomyces japonicus yFS275]